MSQSTDSTQFSSGLEFANLVASSNVLLRRSWKSISGLHRGISSNQQQSTSLKWHREPDSDLTIIAFVTEPITPQDGLVSSRDLPLRENYNFPHFEFLCSKKIPSFSVNKTAVDLFCSHRDQLSLLKSQIDHSKPLIVTGHAVGGSIAALFTLWLLGNPAPVSARRREETASVQHQKRHRTNSRATEPKRPLCITFGSPLIGDQNLRQALLSQSSTWNSCFLNVASHQDPFPRLFISGPNTQTSYRPFGTFLLSSDKGSACFEDPESILDLLVAMGSMNNPIQGMQMQACDYGTVVENLSRKVICKDSTPLGENLNGSLPATITLQLWALGFSHIQKELMEKLEAQASQKKKTFDASKKLFEGKMYMTMLEWYKKKSKMLGVGYYDNFKKEVYVFDQDAVLYKGKLTASWEKMVAEAEKEPQKDGAALRKRWLTAAINFMRMVEPLDIAAYYRSGRRRDYVKQGRSALYIKLEEWLKEDETDSNGLNSSKKENVENILTLDSCFWAHVEEAILMTQQLGSEESSIPEKELARLRLNEFEEYVYGLLKNSAVSSEVFLDSSYMDWWRDYKNNKGELYDSPLAKFMNDRGNYELYAKGEFNFP